MLRRRQPGSRFIPTRGFITPAGSLAAQNGRMHTIFDTLSRPEELRARGRAERDRCPRAEHRLHRARSGGQAVEIVLAGNEGRVPELVPLRMARMAASPFAFFRGAAAVMARDLDAGPATELAAIICGDAHLSNVGFFASTERRLTMDLNDFDEAVTGPFEYDLKRMAASLVVAAQDAGIAADHADEAVSDMVRSYATTVRALSELPVDQAWALSFDRRMLNRIKVGHLADTMAEAAAKAESNNSARAARKMTERLDDDWRFTDDPPILRRLVGPERAAVRAGLDHYVPSIARSRAMLLSRYRLTDLAFRVVGVGSVGRRAYIALLHGNHDDPLLLQVKEAADSCFAGSPRCRPVDGGSAGEQVVTAQRIMQTMTDPLLGWTVVDGRPALVRTFRNLKGSIDVATLQGRQLDDYGRLCGALLARAHARSIDPLVLTGYCGGGGRLARALVDYANAYAEQNAKDHNAFQRAIRAGQVVTATCGEPQGG